MFGKIAADALGLSDVGIIVDPKDYNTVDADDYLFHEDGEQIFFLIKSRKDEYCFTNLALIHVDGESAVSSKRSIRRFDYAAHDIRDVTLETAGTVDIDVELKFSIGELSYSIDVRKKFLEQLKDIYKALITIGRMQREDVTARENALRVMETVGTMYRMDAGGDTGNPVRQFEALLTGLNEATLKRHKRKDFAEVFARYIAR